MKSVHHADRLPNPTLATPTIARFPYRYPPAETMVERTLSGLGSVFRAVGAALDEFGIIIQGSAAVKEHGAASALAMPAFLCMHTLHIKMTVHLRSGLCGLGIKNHRDGDIVSQRTPTWRGLPPSTTPRRLQPRDWWLLSRACAA